MNVSLTGGTLAAALAASFAVAGDRTSAAGDDTTPADAPNQTVADPPAPPPPSVQLTEHVLTDLDSVEVILSLPPGWGGDGWGVGTGMTAPTRRSSRSGMSLKS